MNTQTESTIRNPKSAIGFSLTELLVVIGVIVILFTVAVPNVRKLTGSGDTAAAVNTFSAAVASARTYAGLSPAFDFGSYSGVAIIVDTAGNLRLTTNAEKFPGEYWQDGSSSETSPNLTNKFLVDAENQERLEEPVSGERHAVNGYVDIPGRDYTKLPANTGLLGIVRGGTGSGELQLLHPPFAIRFNREGTFIASKNINTDDSEPFQQVDRVVIYDGNYDGEFWTKGSNGAHRGNPYSTTTYNVNQWDPESSTFDASFAVHASGRIKLPFEKLETVAGILAYSKADMPDNLSLSDGGMENDFGSGTVGQWLMDNGTIIFINRYTGALNKQE